MYVNVVFAVIATIGGLIVLAPHAAEARERIDRIGTALASASMFAIVCGFAHAATKSGSSGWTDGQTIGFIAAGLALPGYADEWFERLDARIEPVIRRLIDRAQQAGALRLDVAPGDLGVILSMLATVSDVPADDVDMLLRRYLELILAGLRPSEARLPGTAPSPQQARQATMPRGRRGSAAGSLRKPPTRPAR